MIDIQQLKIDFIKMVSKIDKTFEDDFNGEFNSPELIWDNIILGYIITFKNQDYLRELEIKELKEELTHKNNIIHTFKSQVSYLTDQLTDKRNELLKLYNEHEELQCSVANFSIVRWYENNKNDVVCINDQVGKQFVDTHNKLAGDQVCYLDKNVFIPLK
jgi:uncharacterized coiled-coil protein SlyX